MIAGASAWCALGTCPTLSSDPVFFVRFHMDEFPEVSVEVFEGVSVHEPVVLRFAQYRSSGRRQLPGREIEESEYVDSL